MKLTKGKASLSEKPLEQGYQIGFDQDIKQGTSGGPALNSRGELVGIIGRKMDRYGVPNSLYTFADGTKPSSQNIEKFKRLAWAIPLRNTNFDSIEKLLKETPIADNTVQFVIDSENAKKELQAEEYNKNIIKRLDNIDNNLWNILFLACIFFAFALFLLLSLTAKQFMKK